MSTRQNRRVLLIDDMPAIHEDFRKILVPQEAGAAPLSDLESALFGDEPACAAAVFELDSAFQGQEGLAKVQAAMDAGRPYAMAFVDMRMPPGWDGVETIEHLWQVDPHIQVVVCTAFADHTWEQVFDRLDTSDRLLILKKPFDAVEVLQLAKALTAKWQMGQDAALKMAALESAVALRTAELQAANDALQHDIVRRIRDEAELKLAASVFHNTLDGVMVLDADRRIVSVNPAFTDITGYRLQDAVGQPASMLRCDRQGPEFYKDMWLTLEREGRWCGELWNLRQDGQAFLAWLNFVKVPGSNDQPQRYVSVFHDITELRRKEDHIRHMAFHDALTGLPNRALLHDRIDQAIAMAKRDHTRIGLMFIDLDRFKAVNDSYGHECGNALLKELAQRLRACVRESDTVARLGGDEFVVLLRGVDEVQNYGLVAQKIIAQLSAPVHVDGHTMQVGASVGIACFPDDGLNLVDLMKYADAAMYAAKGSGRGRYRFFQRAMSDDAVRQLELEMELRTAIDNGELTLYYQPQVSLETGAPRAVEALVRWRHPKLGLLPPGEFIPMAEATGVIVKLGDWVIAEACRQAAQWRAQGIVGLPISVNVSAPQFQYDLVERIVSAAAEHGVPPSCLEIELTETLLMANPTHVSGVLERLRALGVLVAVDDFGTGYSSLAYLRRLPIDMLKIDRSFVMKVDADEGDAQVVKLVLALGRALNLQVVAEGVETASQATVLRDAGCAIAQGYLYARPEPPDQVAAWLRAHPAFDDQATPHTSLMENTA